jgi:hypothetical protein
MRQPAFVSSLSFYQPELTGFYLGIAAAPTFGARVSAQGFAFTWHARPAYRTESNSSIGSAEPGLCGLAFCFQLLSTGIYPGLNEATWALAAGFVLKVIPLCTGLSGIY